MSKFLMPSLGADMEEATLTQWLVKPGDHVRRGDVVAVVETAKGAIEIEIFEDGVIQTISVSEGERAPVGATLALISTKTEAAKTEAPKKEAALEQPKSPSKRKPGRASPAARKRAKELGLNLNDVEGSGPDGAVTLSDLERLGVQPKEDVGEAGAKPYDITAMRQTIAAAMARSKREIPHYYLATTVNMQAVETWLKTFNKGRQISERLPYLVPTLKAVALGLRKVPELNGFYTDDNHQAAEAINIGIAVSLRGGGLVAPALSHVDQMTLEEIAANLNDLIERARRGALRAKELSGPTITLSNMGERGVETLYGVITPPQVALVGLGRMVSRPCADDNGGVVVSPLMQITLSADHRVSSGHQGALFLNAVDKLLQTPEEL